MIEGWVSAAAASSRSPPVPTPCFTVKGMDHNDSVSTPVARGVTEGAWLLVGDKELMVNNIVSDMTLDTLVMLRVVRADDHRAQAEPLPSGRGARVKR